jgi:FMN-dependent NADH-azoreductase
MTHPAENVLLITSSARGDASVSTRLAKRLADRLAPGGYVHRDVSAGLPMIDGAWVGAAFTDADDRDAAQAARLAMSEALIAEVRAADTLVIALPIYNFAPPAQLKAWIDHVARAGLTFRYTQDGPQGLLTGKKAYIAVASGGTPMGSDIDFATPWLRHVLGFIGIKNVEAVAADRQGANAEAEAEADAAIERLVA